MEKEKLVALVTAGQKGDAEALNSLFNAFYNDVYYFALKTVKDQDLACDITQETFLKLINSLGELKEPAAFVTWMKQITYHECVRYFKKKKEVLADGDEDGGTVFDNVAEDRAEFIPDEALDAYFDADSKNARVSWYSAPSGINWTWSFPNVYRTAGEQIDVVWLCFEDSTNELLAYTLAVFDMQTGLFSDVEWTMTSVGSSYSYALAGGAGDSTEAQPNEDAMGAKNPASLLPDFAEELDQARADRDDEIAAGFLNTVCTWDSYAEYTAAREQIMADYDLTESSQFMSVFMPEIGNITSSDGTNYNKIDVLGLNMTDQRIKSYVTKIDGGDYSYFTVVDVRSTWENGGESVVQAVLLYTVDAGGSLSDVYAVPVI